MDVLVLDNVALHWREDGDRHGRPIVFANSLGTDLRLWDRVLPYLPAGLRLIRFDKRGHGLSSCPTPPYSMDDLVADTEALLDHLGVKDSVFVGLSIGGMIGLQLADRRPDLVDRLVLSNTAPQMGSPQIWQDRISDIQMGGLDKIADDIVKRWFTSEFLAKPEVVIWRNMLCRTSEAGYIGCCDAISNADMTAVAKALAQRALVLAGADDKASPPSLVRDLASLLQSADMDLFEGVGHLPPVEAPQAFAARVFEFLEETTNV